MMAMTQMRMMTTATAMMATMTRPTMMTILMMTTTMLRMWASSDAPYVCDDDHDGDNAYSDDGDADDGYDAEAHNKSDYQTDNDDATYYSHLMLTMQKSPFQARRNARTKCAIQHATRKLVMVKLSVIRVTLAALQQVCLQC